jgi:hypothetical protein
MSDSRVGTDPDAPPTPEEEAAAASLAEALEAPSPQAVPPELEVAVAALRAAAPVRPDAQGLARVLDAGALAPPGPSFWRWLLPVGGLAAAATAAALLLLVAPPGPTGLPPPSRELLVAQAEAARGVPQPLERAMRGYRREVYAALRARYGEAP